jgi:hypothetical protein
MKQGANYIERFHISNTNAYFNVCIHEDLKSGTILIENGIKMTIIKSSDMELIKE